MTRRPHRPLPRSRGFAMVTAIFLLVVMALLGGMMVTMSNSQQIGAARDLLGSRAYYAARAGIEWGAYQALQSGSCAASSSPTGLATATGFGVVVTCTANGPYDEGGSSVTLYQITATASTGTLGQPGHAERQLQAVVSSP